MPLPTPNTDEAEEDFISRCMSDEQAVEDFEDEDQRLAVCQRQWDEGKAMSNHETKAVGSVEIKDADEGKVRAVIATLGVKDRDGDVIEEGAFGKQGVIVSPFGHSSWVDSQMPVGRGTITESGSKAIADVDFFLDTQHGRDAFQTVKGLDELGEWSFGFDVKQAREPNEEEQERGVRRVLQDLAAHEVSPVARGAGIDTRTVMAKAVKMPLPDVVKEYLEEVDPDEGQVEEAVKALEEHVEPEEEMSQGVQAVAEYLGSRARRKTEEMDRL